MIAVSYLSSRQNTSIFFNVHILLVKVETKHSVKLKDWAFSRISYCTSAGSCGIMSSETFMRDASRR